MLSSTMRTLPTCCLGSLSFPWVGDISPCPAGEAGKRGRRGASLGARLSPHIPQPRSAGGHGWPRPPTLPAMKGVRPLPRYLPNIPWVPSQRCAGGATGDPFPSTVGCSVAWGHVALQ